MLTPVFVHINFTTHCDVPNDKQYFLENLMKVLMRENKLLCRNREIKERNRFSFYSFSVRLWDRIFLLAVLTIGKLLHSASDKLSVKWGYYHLAIPESSEL